MTDPRTGERVEIFKGEDGDWYFRRVAANNKTVADGEGYKNFGDVESEVLKLFGDVAIYVQSIDGTWSLWEGPNSQAPTPVDAGGDVLEGAADA